MKVGSLVELKPRTNKTPEQAKDQIVAASLGQQFPKKGVIYTVRGFTPSDKGIYLEEIVNKPLHTPRGLMEVGFIIEDFREIQPPMSLEFIEEMQHPLTLLQTK